MSEATEKQINYAKSLGIDNPGQYSKETLRELIEKQIEGEKVMEKDLAKPAEDEKMPLGAPKEQKNTGYYVSYAKDILVALINGTVNKDLDADKGTEEFMNISIARVKQAIKAFE